MASRIDDGDDAGRPGRWPPGGNRGPDAGPGRVIDRDQLDSDLDRATADLLAAEGHEVVAIPRRSDGRKGRTADSYVDGVKIEFKHPGSRPQGGQPDSDTVTNEVLREWRDRQADHFVVDGRGHGLRWQDAERAIHRVEGALGRYPELGSLRVIADGPDGRPVTFILDPGGS